MAAPRRTKSNTQRKQNDILFYFSVGATYLFPDVRTAQVSCPAIVQNRRGGATQARPIHMALLRFTDKQYILRNAAAKLKDHPFQEANLFISDDVFGRRRRSHPHA